jgi:hypothetical protein
MPHCTFILVLSPGRSGTYTLASLFSCCKSCVAKHEPKPNLASYKFAQGSLEKDDIDARLQRKVDAIMNEISHTKKSSLGGNCVDSEWQGEYPHTYVETNHTLLHSSAAFALMDKLLSLGRVGVVIPRRSPPKIVLSRCQLGHGTRYQKKGETLYRGVGWIYTPSSSLAVLPSIKSDTESSQLVCHCNC